MIRELHLHEIDYVSGGGLLDFKFGLNNLSLRAHADGAIWGAIDGALTGFALGGKWAGAGGFLVGGISQLAGFALSGIVGGIGGGVAGWWVFGQAPIANLTNSFRNSSALGGNTAH